MTWSVICHLLTPFGVAQCQNSRFEQGDKLLLLNEDALDLPNTVYITDGQSPPRLFHHALIVSVGPYPIQSDNLIELQGGDLTHVFNILANAKNKLDNLNATLTLCDNDQEAIDRASILMGIPMFYLDESYRILAITKSLNFRGDEEWVHMSEKGFLSPKNARRMKEAGDLDMLAPARAPVIYQSKIYPFSSIICNIWISGRFIARLNVLCTDGNTSPPVVRACELVAAHLTRILERGERLPHQRPLETMLMDLLHGVQLSRELIEHRIQTVPHLSGSLMQIFFADVKAKDDLQMAPYYASLLKRLYPEESFLPLVYQEQLLLLAYGPSEEAFNNLTVKLAHFFATHHIRCGVSNHFRALSHLKGYFEQAAACLNRAGEGLYFYRDIMLEQMLSHIPPEQAQYLISPDVHRLEEAAKQYAFSPLETLKVYLECNCNLIRTAERLYLHKNTLLYRLNHIKSIIRCDLNDTDERLLLLLSFKLLDRTTRQETLFSSQNHIPAKLEK